MCMSFLGAVGHLMQGSGLKSIVELMEKQLVEHHVHTLCGTLIGFKVGKVR